MKWTFRWFGHNDPVPLAHVTQIPGLNDVTTSLLDVPAGVAWPAQAIRERKALLAKHGLTWTVVESIPVTEAIKTAGPDRDVQLAAWIETMERLAAEGVTTVCYNFMPVFDWWRSTFDRVLDDGSNAMAYDQVDVDRTDVRAGVEQRIAWAQGYSAAEMEEAFAPYDAMDESDLLGNLAYFLDAVTPTAERLGVRLALHPDDPPWPIFGLPRIVGDEASIARILDLTPSPAHGLTFCTGSLGANSDNDLVAMARRFAPRVAFVHARNVRHHGVRSFHEVAHHRGAGDVDLPTVLRVFAEAGVSVPLRPDHGRMIWGETGIQGYGLYDRALGLAYLQGIWEALNVE